MRRSQVALTCAFLLVAAAARAQAPPAGPRPGPETQKLGYFLGRWTIRSEMKPGPFGPGGTMTGTDACEWFAGGFHLVCRAAGKGARGDFKGMSILSWDPQEKAYTLFAIDRNGMTERARGTLAGDTWTWESDSKMGGKSVKGRYTITAQGPAAYSIKWEASVDGGPMILVMEGRESKAR
jgi:uncharacterized protein DUF1579